MSKLLRCDALVPDCQFEARGSVEEPRFNGFDLSDDSAISFSRVRADGTRDVFRAFIDQSGDISVTTDGDSSVPVWSNDGRRIAFASARARAPFVHTEDTVTQQETGWPTEDLWTIPRDWAPDDDVLVYDAIDPAGRADIAFLHFDGERHERFRRNTPEFNESFAAISPDGGWIVWVTDESGVPQVWADRYPTLDDPRFVANGNFPKWRSDGGELYFVSDGVLMARRVSGSAANLDLEESEEVLNLAGLNFVFSNAFEYGAPYEPSSDGQRFLLHVRSAQSQAPPVKVLVNWENLIEDE